MRTTTTNRPPERGSHTAETSFIEGSGNLTREFKIQEAEKKIKYNYPYQAKIDLTINDSGKIVAKGPGGGNIEVFKVDRKSFLANFINKFKDKLGLPRDEILDKLKKDNKKLKKIYCRSTKNFKRYH